MSKKVLVVLVFSDSFFSKKDWEDLTSDLSKKKNKSIVLWDPKKERGYGALYPNQKSMRGSYKSQLRNKKVLKGYKAVSHLAWKAKLLEAKKGLK